MVKLLVVKVEAIRTPSFRGLVSATRVA